ncbi:MAG: methyltransferase domain-containing protein, partial [Desulfobacterales bacterium]
MTRLNTRITMLLTRLRDMRIVWDVMGPLYNRRIAESYRRQRNIFNCSFHQSDVLSLQFKDAAFDAAVSAGSIKHWSDSRRGLMELHRVLKPGGCLIIAETDR